MRKAKIYKAQGIGGQEVESLLIEFSEGIPAPFTDSGENDTGWFERNSIALEFLLYHVLPGGTYCRLLGEMLKRKASHFVVSHGGLDAS